MKSYKIRIYTTLVHEVVVRAENEPAAEDAASHIDTSDMDYWFGDTEVESLGEATPYDIYECRNFNTDGSEFEPED